MDRIEVNNSEYPTAQLLLPGAAGKNVLAGSINVTGLDGNDGVNGNDALNKTYDVNLTITVTEGGIMQSSIAISGEDYIARKNDDPATTQVVYWNNIEHPAPTIAEATNQLNTAPADQLSSTLTPGQLTSYYTGLTDTINQFYHNQNMILGWVMVFEEHIRDTNNKLSKHARHHGRAGGNIFQADDKLVCRDPFEYSVSIANYLNVSTPIISPTNVYGVLKQI
jgi:hypothetical protein